MARYVVERTFVDGLKSLSMEKACFGVEVHNAESGATCIHSYVSEDKTKTYSVCDRPNPEAIRWQPRSTASRSIPSPE